MTNSLKLTDEQIKEHFTLKVANLKKELKQAELILSTLSGIVPDKPSIEEVEKELYSPSEVISSDVKITGTFEQQQVKYLEQQGRLVGSRELYDAHCKRNERYNSSIGTFSGQLSQRCAAKNAKLKKYVVDYAPNQYRFWYGKKDWFIGNDLKEFYKDKVYKEVENLQRL